MLLLLDILVLVSLPNVFLVEELRPVLSLLEHWEMTLERLMSSPCGSLPFSFLTLWGELHDHRFLWEK